MILNIYILVNQFKSSLTGVLERCVAQLIANRGDDLRPASEVTSEACLETLALFASTSRVGRHPAGQHRPDVRMGPGIGD